MYSVYQSKLLSQKPKNNLLYIKQIFIFFFFSLEFWKTIFIQNLKLTCLIGFLKSKQLFDSNFFLMLWIVFLREKFVVGIRTMFTPHSFWDIWIFKFKLILEKKLVLIYIYIYYLIFLFIKSYLINMNSNFNFLKSYSKLK